MRSETVFSANKRKKKIQKSKIEPLSPEYQKEIFFFFPIYPYSYRLNIARVMVQWYIVLQK